MKLIKCYISAFGKLKDFSYDFNENLNTIVQENGWGKSTFATFIKAMFYGLNDSKRSVSENERLKYKPWASNDRFGGYIIFTIKEKTYKLERFFGTKSSDDSVRLFDLATGKEYPVNEELGKHIFKIDEEGFLSTTYFSQKDFQVKSNTSLTAKFNDVCEIQDTDAFDKALLRVEEKAKTFKYSGGRGIIPDTKRTIHDLEEEIARAERSIEVVDKLKKDAEELSKQVDMLQTETDNLTKRVVDAGKVEAQKVKKSRYEKLINEKNELLDRKKTAEEVLNGNTIDVSEVEKLQEKNNQLIAIDARVNSVKKDIFEFESSNNNNKPYKFSRANLILCVITLFLCVALFVSLFALKIPVLSIILGVLVVFCVFAVGRSVIYKLTSNKHQNDGINELINKKQDELYLLEEEKKTLTNQIDGYISKFNLDNNYERSLALGYILKVWDIYKGIEQKLFDINKEIADLQIDFKSINLNDQVEDIAWLNGQLKHVQEEHNKKARELAEKRSSIRAQEDIASSITDLESKKAELCEKLLNCEEEFEILTLTARFLKQADETLKVKYKEPLQNSMKKYFDLVNGGEKPINIDIDFKVTVEEDGQMKTTDFYSKGYQNLFEICKRFALTDVLFTGEKPFIILDDPFYNLDDKKIKASVSLIKELSKEYQILYFVCHESRGA